ncbi:family 20 glycosylhydrolase [Ruficoccus amylovorans]|uniref:Family 20 glycosylhydrolase n=1 Tax=Ruficoccus amylovorans TaxID=1804625 RepID=A0A842HEC5_9BACT|nr:family 20 glycosylhydrolase [Ruficoccus amylovorans]MBC2594782.1 family 20 glycosylhydrolase [Ruficoccus amylovorans]
MHLFPQPRSLKLHPGTASPHDALFVSKIHDNLAPGHYTLRIGPDKIEITGGDTAALAYADDTLAQIRAQSPEGQLPRLEISDGPAFRERGYMLDISRCKVPTMDELLRLVDRLATLRYNQLQLYTEHTFAYTGHESVWRDSSPLTGEEIEQLDAACAARHIELVPNQNSFGHLERWLRHPAYRHLAECPDGFTSPFGDFRPYGATLKPNADSLAFLDELYTQLLPHFRSRRVNVGCDETFDLGLGWSRPQVEAEGIEEIYLEFLEKIGQLVEKHGHQMLFWADIVLKRPELIDRLPAGSVPVVWGYERDHPFAEQCAQMAAAGLEFQVAPGDSTWLSTHGRLETAQANIALATREGLRHGAHGLLLTHWGDQGHIQPYALSLPALVMGSQYSWEGAAANVERWPEFLSTRLLNDTTGEFARTLAALGSVESLTTHRQHNRSVLFRGLFAEIDEVRALAEKITPVESVAIATRLDEAEAHLSRACPRCPDADWLRDEAAQSLRLTRLALARLESIRTGKSRETLLPQLEEALSCHESQWLLRNRPGGLPESRSYFTGLRERL